MTECDLHLVAHSIGGNAKSFMPTNCLDDLGYVKVRETFEVEVSEYSLLYYYFFMEFIVFVIQEFTQCVCIW